MLPFLVAALVSAAPAAAPVAQVTVFNDRARVVRVADLALHGKGRFDLALLPDSVEPGSIRLELSGGKNAVVEQVDLHRVDTDLFPEDEARKLLDLLDEADDRLALAEREKASVREELAQVEGLRPIAPQPDLHGPAPKLNASGWAQVLAFLGNSSEHLQARLRDASARIEKLEREREKLAVEAREVGAQHRRSGLQVTAQLSGEGSVRATLTYMVANARWRTSWELTYQPEREAVLAKLDGLVWQATGEEWTRSQLTFSTAIPGQASALPQLLSWRIGEKERFQPESHALNPPRYPVPSPPSALPMTDARNEMSRRDQLREKLLERAQAPLSLDAEADQDALSSPAADDVSKLQKDRARQAEVDAKTKAPHSAAQNSMERKKEQLARGNLDLGPPPPPAPAPVGSPRPQTARRSADAAAAKAVERNYDSVLGVATSANGPVSEPQERIGISPPRAWTAPSFEADAPASLSGGYDLSFNAAHPATLESGSAARRVPLFAESWPVHIERRLYPALAKEAWLVGKLRVPGDRTLPGGAADLFVGNDPAGSARLNAMSPGEEITLPLGIDRALKPERNVAQVQSEKGLFSKDDVDEYAVTIEVANPYSHPVELRVFDQLPLKGNDVVEVQFLKASPEITPEADTGKLEWAFTLPASQKRTLSFSYRLRRPHGARLHQ